MAEERLIMERPSTSKNRKALSASDESGLSAVASGRTWEVCFVITPGRCLVGLAGLRCQPDVSHDHSRSLRWRRQKQRQGTCAHFDRDVRRCLIHTRPNNTTLIVVRIAPATAQIGVSAGKKSPLLSRAKAQAPASSINPQKPVATAGSMPLDPVGSLRGKSGTGSRLNGAAFSRDLLVGSSAGMTESTLNRVPVYCDKVVFARSTITPAFDR